MKKTIFNTYEQMTDGSWVGYTKKGETFLFDNCDYQTVIKYTWSINQGYVVSSITQVNGTKTTLLLHCLLVVSSNQIDHRNTNKTDNRRFNLRICTNIENSYNRGKPKNNTSGFKGVSKSGNRWRVQIYIDGRKTYLGSRNTPEEAFELYKEAADKYHGEFAKY